MWDDWYDELVDWEPPDTEPDWEWETERAFSSGIERVYCPEIDEYDDIVSEEWVAWDHDDESWHDDEGWIDQDDYSYAYTNYWDDYGYWNEPY